MKDTPHTVSDVMTQTVVAVSRGAAFKEIAKTLAQWHVSAVPVLEGEGRVIGVVSEADLLSKQEYKDRDPSRVEQLRHLDELVKAGAATAGELMSTPAVTVHGSATLAEAARVMAHKGVKQLPVVDEQGMLAGIVSRGDLLKVYLRDDEDIAREVREEVVAHFFRNTEPTVGISVVEGVVVLSGRLPDAAMVPLVARLVRAVEGVVNVDLRLDTPPARFRIPEPPVVGPQF
ncbi:CBS domain-containing protein [Streptomyces sp. NPDC020379]|uniref:CBS domain-containing protein n=1 Tax=Streptomyces sp. NPDC020379 TaxID=3365071 RepID=UPI0037AF9A03